MLHRLCARERVPEPRGVLVVAECAEASGHGLILAPVERDGRLVEDSALAVARLVGVVPLVAPKLVVVEDVRAEAERVADLLDLYLRAVGSRDFERCIRLAVPLDVGVDLRLDLVVPDAPVLLAHRRAVDLKFRLGGQGKCKRNSCRQCRLHFVSFRVLSFADQLQRRSFDHSLSHSFVEFHGGGKSLQACFLMSFSFSSSMPRPGFVGTLMNPPL